MFFELLTKQCIGETVPAAPGVPCQPPAAHAGHKAERSPTDGEQHVAGADVDEQQVHWSAQPGEAWEHQEHEKVTEEAQDEDESEGDGDGGVARPAQRVPGGLCCWAVAGAEVGPALEEIYHDGLDITGGLQKAEKQCYLVFVSQSLENEKLNTRKKREEFSAGYQLN